MTGDMEAALGEAMARLAAREREAVKQSWDYGGDDAKGRFSEETLRKARPVYEAGGGQREIMAALGVSKNTAGYLMATLRREDGVRTRRRSPETVAAEAAVLAAGREKRRAQRSKEKAMRRAAVAKMAANHIPQNQIAEFLGIAETTVSRDLRALRKVAAE